MNNKSIVLFQLFLGLLGFQGFSLVGFQSIAMGAANLPISALKGLNGETLTFKNETNKALLVFWATWCADCKEKLTTTLPEMRKNETAGHFEIIAVATDKEKERIEHFVKTEKITLPIFLDTDKVIRKELKIFSVPAWAVIKKQVSGQWEVVDTAQAYESERIQKALQ